MDFLEILDKKKRGDSLSKEDISFWIDGIMNEEIPDYQSSAMLMAICINGMSEVETYYLTMAMANSGDVISWESIGEVVVDKHSTGGVGDKVSLILVPLIATFGINIAKLSGRGLGHTGGTVDKMESINGFNPEIGVEKIYELIKKNHAVMASQSSDIAPADKILYALRDVTSTVDSIPLIASSIMSKKIAAGSDVIVLDVKYGRGAFMKDVENAKKLGDYMKKIGEKANKKVSYILSEMEEPLGYNIGNALEVIEAIDFMRGKNIPDLKQNVVDLCVEILKNTDELLKEKNKEVASHLKDVEEYKYMVEEKLSSEEVYKKFKEIVRSQGGDESMIDDISLFQTSKYKTKIRTEKSGKIHRIDSYTLGVLSMKIGAGREQKDESIDLSAGIEIMSKKGDDVKRGDVICVLHHNKKIEKDIVEYANSAFEIY